MAQSRLTFDPSLGLIAPDTIEIRSAISQAWISAFADPDLPILDVDPTTPAGQLIDAEVAEVEAKNADVLYLSNQFNPHVASGRWQDALAAVYFLVRKVGEPTVVVCQLTGLNGTVIPYGALVKTNEGITLMCNRAVIIEGGVAKTTFRATITGPILVPSHSVQSITTTIPGWDTIDNVDAGVVGRDIEPRAEFEARRYASVAANAHGSVSALYGTLNDISGENGVLDVQVLENVGPYPVIKFGVEVPGRGITICIFGGSDEEIAKIIYEKKDAGCDTGGNTDIVYTAADYRNAVYEYKILRPETINFWVRIKLGSMSTVTPSIVEQIKNAIYTDFLGENIHTAMPRVGLAQTVYASRFYHAVTALEGVKNLLEVSIALADTAPADSAYSNVIEIRGDQEPVISLDNIFIIGVS